MLKTSLSKNTIVITIFLMIFLGLLFSVLPQETNAQTPRNYQIIQPIPEFGIDGSTTNNKLALGTLLNTVFKIGIIVATLLAILMIVLGGIQYMGSESVFGKDAGKERIQAAIGGLILALGAWLILNTINPNLVKVNLDIKSDIKFSGGGLDSIRDRVQKNAISVKTLMDVYDNLSPEKQKEIGTREKFNELSPEEKFDVLNSKGFLQDIASQVGDSDKLSNFKSISGTNSGAILEAAKYAADPKNPLNTCSVANTDNGRLACAYAVNRIVESAIGEPITETGRLSTVSTYNALQKSDKFTLVSGGIRASQPGDIIVSPTNGDNTGHIGIIETTGGGSIISNSSPAREVRSNHTASTWTNTYVNSRGLPVYIFRPN